jgi:hypothetical protein
MSMAAGREQRHDLQSHHLDHVAARLSVGLARSAFPLGDPSAPALHNLDDGAICQNGICRRTIGDVMIAAVSLVVAIATVGHPDWPRTPARSVWLLTMCLGIAYTAYSEWLNVNVRGSWAYSPAMPTLPVLGTGLAPLLQWIVVPILVQRIAISHMPWNARSDE